MSSRALLVLFVTALFSLTASAKTENWLEVNTSHFVILTNSGDKQARRVADQFERMRAVFHKRFPNASVDAASPIIVIAVKDKKDFQALEPEAYLAQGQVNLAGRFLHSPDKDYVLLRLDAEGNHPYAAVYHEYTHFILRKGADWLPLWLNEGWAQFYENTEIKDKEVGIGEASIESLMVLRQNRLLSLATLLAVDHNSPYYHEENKGNIFYAESWALTHYLMIQDKQDKTDRLTNYIKLVSDNVDPVTAATRAFGDLKILENSLNQYISQSKLHYFRMPGTTDVDDTAYQVRSVAPTQARAIQADFLAYNQRSRDARALLDRVLKDEPNNVAAHETMGWLALREGNFDEAAKWYEQAVNLDSQSFLAHYYFAATAMRGSSSGHPSAQVEASLRSAIKLNPLFAPAFDRLAALEGMQHRNLDEALTMALTAVQLDPGNVSYRANAANVLIQMNRGTDAVFVLRRALRVAKSPWETAMVQNILTQAEQYVNARDHQVEELKANVQANAASAGEGSANAETPEEELPKGPHRFIAGTLQNVHCDGPGIELTVAAKGKTMALHRGNYYKIEFTTLGFTPKGDLSPCRDLEGVSAKVEYVESSAMPPTAYVVAIELHK